MEGGIASGGLGLGPCTPFFGWALGDMTWECELAKGPNFGREVWK